MGLIGRSKSGGGDLPWPHEVEPAAKPQWYVDHQPDRGIRIRDGYPVGAPTATVLGLGPLGSRRNQSRGKFTVLRLKIGKQIGPTGQLESASLESRVWRAAAPGGV